MKQTFFLILLIINFANAFCQSIKSSKRIDNDSMYIDFINPYYAPIEISISPLDSTKQYIRVKNSSLLSYRDTLKNALVIPTKKLNDTVIANIKAYIKFKASFGDPNMDIDTNYKYTLPYALKKRYKVIQTFGGKFSHNKIHSKYALDFNMKVGDTITAARSGIVFFIKQDSKEHCPTRKCMNKANKLLILHNDGTIAHYIHLDFQGALVKIGDKIKVGQPIGISGMTGFTTTPHLHLVVHKFGGISIPFYFKNRKNKKLKQGKYYTRRD